VPLLLLLPVAPMSLLLLLLLEPRAAAHQVLQPALPVLATTALLDATPHPHCSRERGTRMLKETFP
jgi:hypothetical protein